MSPKQSLPDETGPMVFVGALMTDTIAAVTRYPAADERLPAETVIRSGGGPASTAAVAAARLGTRDVAFVGTVGDDAEGVALLQELVGEGIDVTGVTRAAAGRTGAAVIVVDVSAGSRAIAALAGPAVQISPAATGIIGSARRLHVDHLGWAAAMPALAALDGRRRPFLSVDISYPVPSFSPRGVDLYAPNIAALAARHPDANGDPDTLLDRALAEGADTVVVTRGQGGCAAATSAGERCAVPAHRIDVVSTLGAGDVFHGALLAALDRGDVLPAALRYAATAAALSCRHLDGRSGIPDHDTTCAAMGTGDPPTPSVTRRPSDVSTRHAEYEENHS